MTSVATVTMQIPTDGITVVAAPPETLTQRNVEQATGIPAATYLETIRAPGFPLPVARLGKLRLVDRVAFLAWVRAGARLSTTIDAPANEVDEFADLDRRHGFENPPHIGRRPR